MWCPLLWSEVHHWHHPSAQPLLWQPAAALARPAAEWKNAANTLSFTSIMSTDTQGKPCHRSRQLLLLFFSSSCPCFQCGCPEALQHFLPIRKMKQFLMVLTAERFPARSVAQLLQSALAGTAAGERTYSFSLSIEENKSKSTLSSGKSGY